MFRKTLFWTHLILGVTGAIFIAIMSFTGAALAYEKELIAWAERDARRVEAPAAGAARLPLDELLRRVTAAKPDARIASIAISPDPRAAHALALPNNVTAYAHPYTGELREPQAPRMRAFMQSMRAWHLRLNFKVTPGQPSLGATLNAAANFGFVILCVTGVVIWWPKAWNSRVLRPSLWFVRDAKGKARDWNWHNVIGIWTLPVLFIMAASGVVLSYRWAGDLVFKIAGETPPNGPPRPALAPAAAPATRHTNSDTVLARLQQQFPEAELITLRFNPPLRADTLQLSPVPSAVIRLPPPWPPFATTTLTLDPQTAETSKTEAFADLTPGMRARRWLRFLHTGEALRAPGQFVAGFACLGACVLCWTGLALAWRRFFRPEKAAATPGSE